MNAQRYGKCGIVTYFPQARRMSSRVLFWVFPRVLRRILHRLRPAWTALCLSSVFVAFAALGGCVSMAGIAPGAPLEQVTAQFGVPAASCPLDGGGQSLVWSTQPYGQTAWHVRTDNSGRVQSVEPALTDASFERLRTGVWTQHDVICTFGPPAERASVGLPGARQIVWSYRYRQSGVWNSLMHVYFGRDGAHVTQAHPGPDPLFEPPEHPLWR